MKTKPNFTYKQFIQKISQLDSSDTQTKTPRTLKSQNKNITSLTLTHSHKPFEKKTYPKESSSKKDPTTKLTPRRNEKKQNHDQYVLERDLKKIGTKNTTNKKIQQRSIPNILNQSSRKLSLKQINPRQGKKLINFSYNQSCYDQQKHNQSCSTFSKNFLFENEDFNSKQNESRLTQSPKTQQNLNSKKYSVSSTDSRMKILPKGNLTERNCALRVNTQYEEKPRNMATDRISTHYQGTRADRESPSFYRLSVDQSSFLDFQQDRSQNNLFGDSNRSNIKKSINNLSCSDKVIEKNWKSPQQMYNEFMAKISQILFEVTRIKQQKKLLNHKVRYIQFLQCLKELKMINNDYQPYSQADGDDLVKQFWEQLVMGHNINHFIIILALILKITPVQQQNPVQLDNFYIIQEKYQQFRLNKLLLQNPKNLKERQFIQENTFLSQPQQKNSKKKTQSISKNKQIYTPKSQSQKKFKINTSINHNQTSHLQSKRQNTSVTTEFQNNNLTKNSLSPRSLSPIGNKRSQLLYKEAKKKSQEKKNNKSTIDYQYEKNKDELTFKPKIIIKRKKVQNQDPQASYLSPRFAIDEQKTVNRMIRGRIQKEVKQLTIERGIPYNEKIIQKMRKQKFEQIIKEQQQSRLRKLQNESQGKLKVSQIQEKTPKGVKAINNKNNDKNEGQNLQNLLDLSFEDLHKNKKEKEKIEQQCLIHKIQTSPLRKPSFQREQLWEECLKEQEQQNYQDYFTLDIYFEQDRSQKLMIRRDSSIEDMIKQAQKFVQKHNLPHQMQVKLKQQLMIAMKFHDIEKIEENDEQEECSLLT